MAEVMFNDLPANNEALMAISTRHKSLCTMECQLIICSTIIKLAIRVIDQ